LAHFAQRQDSLQHNHALREAYVVVLAHFQLEFLAQAAHQENISRVEIKHCVSIAMLAPSVQRLDLAQPLLVQGEVTAH
jgi:hypothetical protein